MPTFEIMGPDGRKHLVQADSQPKALAQFHSLAQQPQGQQASGNWWEAAPLVEAPRRDDGGADIFAGGAQQAPQPERMKQLETALINADQAGDTDAAKVLAAEIQKGRSAQSSPDLDKIILLPAGRRCNRLHRRAVQNPMCQIRCHPEPGP